MRCFAFPFTAMGSSCELKLYAENSVMVRELAEFVIHGIRVLEQRYSRYLENNLLAEINQAAKAGTAIRVDEETAALLNYADSCYQHSDGLFDITSGVLRKAWDFNKQVLPEPKQVEQLLQSVGWGKVTWQNPELIFRQNGMELDFGGIVKEYAADRSATQCLQNGIKYGLINLGGDIRVIGPHAHGEPWSIGIRDPRDKRRSITRIELAQGGICSSGDYERCIKVGNRYFSHLLNPTTGWPVKSLASVTVIADYCLVAGSSSTIAMLKDENGKNWLNGSGLAALWVDTQGQVGKTGSLELQ